MAQTVTVEQFAQAVNAALQEFAGAVDADVEYVTANVAKRARENVVRNIKTSRIGGTGKYAKSIAVRNLKTSGHLKQKVIYAKAPEYRLTHLLEFGQAKVNGGRTRAFPHWEKAEQDAIKDYMKELREAIE